MPTYELALILRSMPRPELSTALKRIGTTILDRGGIIRTVENLGHRAMPYKTSANGSVHREASFFVYRFDVATNHIVDLAEEYKRDVDIVRERIYLTREVKDKHCTLEDELQPPAYRPEVQKMIAIGKKTMNPFTYKFKYNSGLDYYPFQR